MRHLRLHVGSTMIVASFAAFGAGCSDATQPSLPEPEPHVLEAVTPTVLTGVVGTDASPAPVVRVTNASGNPVRGVLVLFEVTAGGGGVERTAVVSDVNGLATTAWTLGTSVQTNRAVARLAGRPGVAFEARPTAGAAVKLQTLDFVQALPAAAETPWGQLSARVEDAFGNPVIGEEVTFAVTAGGGTIGGAVVTSGAEGITTSGVWTLGAPGQNTASASIMDRSASVTFTLSAVTPGVLPSSTYILESIKLGTSNQSAVASRIMLGQNGTFTTYVVVAEGDTLKSAGTYIVGGSGVVFKYSDGFLSSLEEKLGYYGSDLFGSGDSEEGTANLDAIVIPRCFTEDCYDSFWTFRRVP